MKNWYENNILPRLLRSSMSATDVERIRPLVIKNARGVVLEIGVGAGHNIPLYKNIKKLYALEPSEKLISFAKEALCSVPVEFLNAEAESIPLATNSVDTVISTWTLCSVRDPETVLREIKRVLRPEGKFLFVDHGISTRSFVQFLQKALTPITKHFTGNCHMDRDIESLVKGAGFTIWKLEHPCEKSRLLIYNYQGIATYF